MKYTTKWGHTVEEIAISDTSSIKDTGKICVKVVKLVDGNATPELIGKIYWMRKELLHAVVI
jgi:hypothetical protein